MRLTYLQSSTVIIEHAGVRLLCDPWLHDGIYYGAWAQYPPFHFDIKKLGKIDYIYISHIHPDHIDKITLEKLDKNIPILIHRFPEKYLKNTIESMGFKTLELEHDTRTHLKNGLHINILAADDCDPKICGRAFACNFERARFGTNQIDTLAVFDDGKQTILNMNDCPYEIAYKTAQKVLDHYKTIDLLLVGYSGASSYPACYDMPLEEKIIAADKKKMLRMNDAKSYIQMLKPRYYLPFAGRYVLSGKLVSRMQLNGEPGLEEAFDYLNTIIDQNISKGFLLNSYESFDLDSGKATGSYIPIDTNERQRYLEYLSKRKLDYEDDAMPENQPILDLIPKAFDRFTRHRNDAGFYSDTQILIDIGDKTLKLPCDGACYEFVPKDYAPKKYLKLSMDMRLLYRILRGPKFAHWNNADISYHILWKRIPNVYEMGVYYCLNFFHA